MVPIAPGSDGGGSIRIPAAFCGLVGFKPSKGALPNPHAAIDRVGISAIGPLARTVADAAALTDVLAGGSAFARAAAAPALPGLRIRMVTTTPLGAVDREIAAAVTRAARTLESMGHHIEEAPAIQGTVDEFLPLMARMVANVPLVNVLGRALQPTTRWMRDRGRRTTQAQASAAYTLLRDRIVKAFGDADAWLTPTTPILAPEVGSYAALDGEGVFRKAALIGAFTAPFNASGQPAVSLPAGRSSTGVPIGIQLVGRPSGDLALWSLASAYFSAASA
jgi:amidase